MEILVIGRTSPTKRLHDIVMGATGEARVSQVDVLGHDERESRMIINTRPNKKEFEKRRL